jgi:hypothetical protein
MNLTSPDWLTRRGGALRPYPDGQTWSVTFDHQPQYLLRAIPAGGKFSCQVEQTINGKRLEGIKVCSTSEEALAGGLEILRLKLGW